MDYLETLMKILSILSAILVGFYIPYTSMKQKQRDLEQTRRENERDQRADEKLGIRMKVVIEKLESLELFTREIDKKFTIHTDEDNFRKEYRAKIKIIVSESIKNELLHQNFKSIISYFAELLEKFGLNFYYSQERKQDYRARKKILNSQYTILIDELEAYINKVIDNKTLMNSNTPQRFVDLVREAKLYNSIEILIIDLARNGLSDEKLIEKFEDTIDKFISDIIKASVIWGPLEKRYSND
jgi:hypothetical protein